MNDLSDLVISASQALRLPTAGVSDSDWETAVLILRRIDGYVREHMKRGGCEVPIDADRLNPQIAYEVMTALRRQGWIVEIQQRLEASRLDPSRRVPSGMQIALRPSNDAYDDADGFNTMSFLEKSNGH